VFGELLQKIILARFSRYFSMMYQTGIPILDALRTSEEIVANRVLTEALVQIRQQIEAGNGMSESFSNTGLFPPLVVRMIRVGETTGALDKSLNKISYFYDRDITEGVERLMKLIEPALTVLLGVILAFIMIAVLGPLYGAFAQMKI
jgi:type IV pilus assembly protein PilC